MRIRKRILGLILMVVILVCTGLGLWYLQTDNFQELARRTLVSRLEKSLNLNCSIARIKLDLIRGRFLIAGLELRSRIPGHNPVSLRVQEIKGKISLRSIWRFHAYLAELDVIKPQIKLLSGEGKSSWDPEEILKTLRISLRLEAARVTIQDGWLSINNHLVPLNLSLESLNCGVRYAKDPPTYKIHIGYKHSRLLWEERDITHDLDMKINLSLQGLQIESFSARHDKTLLSGNGQLGNWQSPRLALHVTGTIDSRDMIFFHQSLNQGRGDIKINADLISDDNGISAKGKFRTQAGSYRSMNYSSIAGNFEIRKDVLYLREVSGSIKGGSLLVNGEIQLREANKAPNSVRISTKGMPVIEVGRFLNLPLLNFDNLFDSKISLVWQNNKQDLKVDCETDLHGLAQPATSMSRSTLLQGNARFSYYETGEVNISSASLNSPYTTVQALGGKNASLHLQVITDRIAEPLGILRGFSPQVDKLLNEQPELLNMPGRYSLNGDIWIKPDGDIDYDGNVTIKNGAWRSGNIDNLTAQVAWSAPRLDLKSIVLTSGLQKAEGDLELEIPRQGSISNLNYRGKVRDISLAGLENFGVKIPAETGGILSGDGYLAYKQRVWEGEGKLRIENGSFGKEKFDSAQAKLQLENHRLHILNGEAGRGSSKAFAEGFVDLDTRALNLSIRLQELALNDIPAVREKHLPIQGYINVSGAVRGRSDSPTFKGAFELENLRYDTWDLGTGKGMLELKDGVIDGNAGIKSQFGGISAKANIHTDAGYPGKMILDLENLDIQKILSGKIPAFLTGLNTSLNGKVEVEGNLDDFASLKMRGELEGARFAVQNYEFHSAGQILFTVSDNKLRLEKNNIIGDGTSLMVGGIIPIDDSPQLDVNLNGNLNLRFLEHLEKKLHLAGSVDLNIRATGTTRDPQIIGQTTFKNARVEHSSVPLRFTSIQGDVIFSRNMVRIENVHGMAGSGKFQLSGFLEHQNTALRLMNLSIAYQNVRLPYPKDFRTVSNGRLVLSGNADTQILTGDVDITRAEYLKGFNLLEQLTSRGSAGSGSLTTESRLLGLRLNVDIYSDNGLIIDNELARLRGSLRLTLRGTPAFPSLAGRAEAAEGTIFFRGNRFEILHARADFIDRNRINPVLDIRAEADVKTYRLLLEGNGALDNLSFNITSDPPLATVDVLSLLTTGKSTDLGTGTSRSQSEMMGLSAASVLSENLTGVLGKRVQRIFGLESFRVDPFLAGAENDPTARITISERISKDLAVTFSRNLSTNQEQIVVIEYDVSKDLSIVATRDEDGKYGLDFRFKKRF